jgi:plastocyanin
MTRSLTRPIALGTIALAATAGVAAVPATSLASKAKKPAPKPKVVKVEDDFYSVSRLKIKPGTQVKFQWAKTNFDSHNVTLHKGPKGINDSKFTSRTGASGIRFSPTFTKPGTYHFHCTIHRQMMVTITVKR